jgi:hypothetical protein
MVAMLLFFLQMSVIENICCNHASYFFIYISVVDNIWCKCNHFVTCGFYIQMDCISMLLVLVSICVSVAVLFSSNHSIMLHIYHIWCEELVPSVVRIILSPLIHASRVLLHTVWYALLAWDLCFQKSMLPRHYTLITMQWVTTCQNWWRP